MLRIAHWAQAHPRSARLLLIPAHILLIMVSIRFGLALDLAGVTVPGYAPVIAALVCALGVLFFVYGGSAARATWRRRIITEGTILTGAIIAIALVSAQVVATPAIAPVTTSPSARFTSLTYPDTTLEEQAAKPQRRDQRLWRRALRTKAKTYLGQQQGKIDGWGAGVLIFLTVVLATFLELLVLALSCSIACNGAEGLAIIVGILGTVGVVFLAVLAIGSILRAYRRGRDPNAVPRKRSPRSKVLE